MDKGIGQHTTCAMRLGAMAVMLALAHGAAAAAQPAAAAKGQAPRAETAPRCSGEAARPGSMALQVGKSNLMRLPEPVMHRSVGNPGIVQSMLVAPDTLYLVGVDIGTTNMIIQGKGGSCSVIDITVSMDPTALQATLASVMPEEKNIRVQAAADSLILTGDVSDGAAVARANDLAQAFVRRAQRPLAQKSDDKDAAPTPSAAASAGLGPRIVNMLSVSAPQQVMLEVKIAEVSKTLLERLEAGTTLKFNHGSWATTLLSNFLTGTARGLLDARKTNGNQLTLEAHKQDGLVRILAEPTVMAISGQEGSFLAGGKIFIPVAQENNRITLEEKEFGVGLRFTPTVLSGGRINLRVSPEVSEISREGIGISAAGFTGGSILPLITTRRASTTVQLYDGQSFAIGGLIKNNLVNNLKGLPAIGEVPVLGALFRSTDYQQDRTELVFVVTAHLVKPLPPDFTLPTDKLMPAGRAEFLLGGKMEGRMPETDATPAVQAAAPSADAARGFELK
ncbi:type II and III secretion system protein family protein [Massilia sp. GCM10020059]|uniref:Type II and III secretion system protein family protein n=1 Tax=Massilia agrisoli TaxID=2892444 RepID=A0ABS8IS15_9BURK|nr:type II and III secretion system protein family protein [Massilia agrisoli]MCC6070676.1 type II and III secretion system protein family protein [Massilia agrisoli]